MFAFWERKVAKPMRQVLETGVSAEKLSLSLAMGVTLGNFPLPGFTTAPVLLAVYLFNLNPVVALLSNFLVTPLNLASAPAFIYYGNEYLGGEGIDKPGFSMETMFEELKTDTLGTLFKFQFFLMNGILAWAVCLPFATGVLYIILLPFMKTLNKNYASAAKKK